MEPFHKIYTENIKTITIETDAQNSQNTPIKLADYTTKIKTLADYVLKGENYCDSSEVLGDIVRQVEEVEHEELDSIYTAAENAYKSLYKSEYKDMFSQESYQKDGIILDDNLDIKLAESIAAENMKKFLEILDEFKKQGKIRKMKMSGFINEGDIEILKVYIGTQTKTCLVNSEVLKLIPEIQKRYYKDYTSGAIWLNIDKNGYKAGETIYFSCESKDKDSKEGNNYKWIKKYDRFENIKALQLVKKEESDKRFKECPL